MVKCSDLLLSSTLSVCPEDEQALLGLAASPLKARTGLRGDVRLCGSLLRPLPAPFDSGS